MAQSAARYRALGSGVSHAPRCAQQARSDPRAARVRVDLADHPL